jgi:hypothetical protein
MDMKKLVTGLFALVLIVSVSQAQDRKERKHHGKRHHKEMLSKELNFSDEQKKQLNNIKADFKKQMSELKKNDNITVKEYRNRKETIRKENFQKRQALLTPEQKSKMEKMKEENLVKAKERDQKKLEGMKTKLNLTDDQMSKLKASHEAFGSKAKEIRNNQSLTSDQKKEQFKALAEQRKEESKSIFTSEQLEKMKQMHKDRRSKPVK